MKLSWTTSRMLALTAVVLVAAGATVAIGTPRGAFEPMLGPEWQCSRTVLFLTTCSHAGVRPE
jgi:hypothetical protein